MEINLTLWAGGDTNNNECRILIDAFRAQADGIRRDGHANHSGDAVATLGSLLEISLKVVEGFLDVTEGLEQGYERGKDGEQRIVYRSSKPLYSKSESNQSQVADLT